MQESMWHDRGLLVDVYGEPQPKGSMFIAARGPKGMPFAKPRLVADNSQELEAWSSNVRGAVMAAMVGRPRPLFRKQEPLAVHVTFSLPKPASVKRARPSVRPDLDKLLRAALDPLHGMVFADDGAVVSVTASKWYANASGVGALSFVGARIEVWPLDGAKER